MKRLKNENGSITIITLVSILFMVSFLVSSYILISNKVKVQKDMLQETREIYESTSTMEEIYNSYFNNGQIVPIYTVEQLLLMGTETKNVDINGKYYDFNNDENTIYVLMNDIKFTASDYSEQLSGGYWVPVGDRILAYEQTMSIQQLATEEEILLNEQFSAKFEGKNHTIEVIYTDDDNDEYSVIYSQESNYCEPEYEVNVIPRLLDGTVAEDAVIVLDDQQTSLKGQGTVKIKRTKQTTISAYLNDNYTSEKENVLIINPNKINDVYLDIESIDVTLTINATPSNAVVLINGENTNSVTVQKGTTVNYVVSCDEYYTKEGSIQVNQNTTLSVELAPLNYVEFSESFYFTRCTNELYSGLLNGGEASISKYNLGGADYSMGTFYIDESDIIEKIPSDGIVKKVTLYFEYYQDRNNTFLYTNSLKPTMSTGTTAKMTGETERTNQTVKQAQFETSNITREELKEGLSVRMLVYIEGTLEITTTVKNMYCVIEGEKPDI